MDLNELEETIIYVKDSVLKNWEFSSLMSNHLLRVEVDNILFQSSKLFPDYRYYFEKANSVFIHFSQNEVINILSRVLSIIESERKIKSQIIEGKLFDSADDKLQQASKSFRSNDYTSAFHNLNSALELALKDKLDIPVTIPEINTSKVIEVLVSQKLGPSIYLDEAKRRVVFIDNKIKHTGYSPSKVECISAIKAVEDLLPRLKMSKIALSDEVKQKIYEGL